MAPIATLYLCRHGETDLNRKLVLQGRGVNAPLNQIGRQQAALLGEWFKDIQVDVLCASTLMRAQQTAAEIRKQHPDAQYKEYPGICELDFGKREGYEFDESLDALLDKWNLDKDFDAKFEGGESPRDVENRALPTIAKIIESVPEGVSQPGVVAVIHGRLLRILLSSILCGNLHEMPAFSHSNTCVNVIHVYRADDAELQTIDNHEYQQQDPKLRANYPESPQRKLLDMYRFVPVKLNSTEHLKGFEVL
ncbi:phosphoglycerate mutase-like protein [Basidiobolus meristosporus CBS 931.73]|uniref:Phosphoglycerate mutase-like protein n=1 Tax=Basidiobolus meristosporus CBS 931.73 TaxID=1314790 RepID=A0A1Y1YJ44_9FUNG|nr:phosphoglycerate mutase-like protein [Basidiobolus meristosporus CBS 931.73]|eukprot:ORX98002.1 phosphoglycerate mutase-like protein [Basidiobolus meristosporus CBS 931.73]